MNMVQTAARRQTDPLALRIERENDAFVLEFAT